MITNTFLIDIPQDIKDVIGQDKWFGQYDIVDYGIDPSKIDEREQSYFNGPGVIFVDFAPGQKLFLVYGRGINSDTYSLDFQISITISIFRRKGADFADVFDASDKQIKSDVGRMEKFFRKHTYVVSGDDWYVNGLTLVSINWGLPQIADGEDRSAQYRSGQIVLAGQIELGD